jgi:hypothetical protein
VDVVPARFSMFGAELPAPTAAPISGGCDCVGPDGLRPPATWGRSPVVCWLMQRHPASRPTARAHGARTPALSPPSAGSPSSAETECSAGRRPRRLSCCARPEMMAPSSAPGGRPRVRPFTGRSSLLLRHVHQLACGLVAGDRRSAGPRALLLPSPSPPAQSRTFPRHSPRQSRRETSKRRPWAGLASAPV